MKSGMTIIDGITEYRYNNIVKEGESMMLRNILEAKELSIYRLSKMSGVPYATLNDICSGKTNIVRCSAETVLRIAKALDISMEDLLSECSAKRSSFENFKSTICHRVKEKGDIEFIIETLETRAIRHYFEQAWYPESLYLLAMLDYLSRENNVPICSDYDDIRKCKLEKPVYPSGIIAMDAVSGTDEEKIKAAESAIPEFRRFNIIEKEIRNVI